MRVFDGVETLNERLKDKWLKIFFLGGGEEEVFCSSFYVINFVDSLFWGCN